MQLGLLLVIHDSRDLFNYIIQRVTLILIEELTSQILQLFR